ncbi:MAG: glutaconate CoA-transferase, subunit [Actinomycetia bacterium]|nr:glutaconate CoA-transferase, subunit [Actinomycetes bacterium]
MDDKRATLSDAIAQHVRAGDMVHPIVGHTRWTAATRELVRQWWGRDPGFTLVMSSLSSLGALFFRGGLVRKVITGYSGDTFPNFTPNPWFARAYERGEVEVEHWSFLALAQRLEAAARGVPAVVTNSIAGSSMEANDGYARVATPFGEVGMVSALAPDITLLHAPMADREGNVAIHPPLLEGVWGALAASRGAIVTVERIVDDIRPWSSYVRIPGHRVLAVVEAPFGAHPGGLYAGALPVEGYGEDYEFWVEARAATRGDDYDRWIEEWVLRVTTQEQWVERLGAERVTALREKADPASWQRDEAANPPDLEAPFNHWERAAVFGARHLAQRCVEASYDGVLAGAGVANLAAWLGVHLAHEQGSGVHLTAEIGLWGYDATPADPFVLNHRNFPTATMLGDASMVLGTLVGGPGTTVIGCLGGAQIDPYGNVNSTTLQPDGPFLVGSGGGNDVASTADECIVVATLTKNRTPRESAYITSPGRKVSAFVTDLGTFEKGDSDTLTLVAVPAGDGTIDERVALARDACGWNMLAATEIRELPAPTAREVEMLRRWDPNGWFLRAR